MYLRDIRRLLYLAGSGKLIFIFLLINYHAISYSQVIKGTVLDKQTRSSIGYAYLYFSGTFTGTQSGSDGSFELDVSKNRAFPLTISAIGYYSETMTDYLTGKPLLIYLSPKTYELREVNIKSRSLARKRKEYLFLFRKEFLGTTNNANNCVIVNENDITFNYDSDKDTLKAYASKPILIDNRALGYKITYYLDKFEYVRRYKLFFFQGNIIFNEDLSIEGAQKEIFERKRRYAYLGSRMHFFRALWFDDLKSTGFSVRDMSDRILKYKEIVIQDTSSNKYLKYSEDLGICYYSKTPLSNIRFLKDKAYFGMDGYFEPSSIEWEGQMANLRIADWLPYDYSPGK